MSTNSNQTALDLFTDIIVFVCEELSEKELFIKKIFLYEYTFSSFLFFIRSRQITLYTNSVILYSIYIHIYYLRSDSYSIFQIF